MTKQELADWEEYGKRYQFQPDPVGLMAGGMLRLVTEARRLHKVVEDKAFLARHCATRCFECNDEQPAEKRGENCFRQRSDGYMCGGRYVGLCVPREPTAAPTAPPGGQEEG